MTTLHLADLERHNYGQLTPHFDEETRCSGQDVAWAIGSDLVGRSWPLFVLPCYFSNIDARSHFYQKVDQRFKWLTMGASDNLIHIITLVPLLFYYFLTKGFQ